MSVSKPSGLQHFLASLCLLLFTGITTAQTPWSTEVNETLLRAVLPQAESFSSKQGEPPVYSAFRLNPSTKEQELIGYVFLSADLPPEETGYSAPIDMLIGLSVEGKVTGLKILNYIESFRYSRGDFLNEDGFQEQFQNKGLNEDFRLHHDLDGVTNATISSWAISRGVRNAARRVAEVYLKYQPEISEQEIWDTNAANYLATLSWHELLQSGLVVQKEIPTPIGTSMTLSIAYMGRPSLGKFFVGEEDYAKAERDASIRFDTRELVMFAVGGDTSQPFQQQRLSFQQGTGDAKRIHPRRLVSAGSADEGAIAGKAEFAGAIVMDEFFDPNQPFSVFYQPMGQTEPTILRYQFKERSLALATTPERNQTTARQPTATLWMQFKYGLLWQGTNWWSVGLLGSLLLLATTAFLRKSSSLRWLTIGITFLYLGFYDGGFLSVSHMAGLIAQGPMSIVRNFPILLFCVFTLITTLLWGRVFCSSLCPFGALQDIIARVVPSSWRITLPKLLHQSAFWLKYVFLAAIIITAISYSRVSIFQYFEPFGTLFYFSSSILLWSLLIAVVAGSIFVERFYCRYLCPLGAALAVLSFVSPFRIKRVPQCDVCSMCEQACPTGAINGPKINFKECVRCDICEIKLIKRAGSCRHSVEEIERRRQKAAANIIATT